LHHFFEAEVRVKLGSTETFCAGALPLQKNVTAFPPKNFYHKCPSGWSGPATLAKKVLAMDRARANTFFIAVARALAGTSGTERWRDTLSLAQNFLSKPESVGVWWIARLFNIRLLCNPAAEKTLGR
jgi:hypothetical protein